jgi:hypothetical protein
LNIGGSDAENITIQFWLGDPESGGIQINENFTTNLTDVTGNNSNATFNVSWIVTGPGPFHFYVTVDPPTPTNGSIFESNESNNKANKTINVDAYQHVYGIVKNNLYIAGAENESIFSLFYFPNITNLTGNIFIADDSSTISFSSLQALGQDTSNNTAPNDFNDTDAALNMTLYNDSIRKIYTNMTDAPLTQKNMTVFNRIVKNVPIINSTNSSNFITGILWDMNDGNTEFNGTQDLVFITEIKNNLTGAYGIYDYEITPPVNLKNYKGAGSAISLYWEIRVT